MDQSGKVFHIEVPGFQSISSKSRSLAEIPSAVEERSSGSRNRRCSYDMTLVSDATSHECASAKGQQHGISELQLVLDTEISDDVQTDVDSHSVGTYLIVPGQGQTLITAHDDKKSTSFVFSHNDPLSETSVDVQASSSGITNSPNCSKFQVLESVLQERPTPGVRGGFITPQKTFAEVSSVDKIAESDSRSEAEATPKRFASSDDLLDSARSEHPFRVHEEHFAQQRMVSVEREQCVHKEKAALSVEMGPNVPSSHHRAVTVSRSQTWNFRDKSKSDQLLRESGTATTESDKLDGFYEQLLDETSARGLDLTVNSSACPNRSKTLPLKRSSETVRVMRHSLEEPPVSRAVQSCFLRDYDKDKDWSCVPWTDDPQNP